MGLLMSCHFELFCRTLKDESGEPPQKKKKRGGSKVKTIPEPFKIDVTKLDLSELQAAGKQFRQYRFSGYIYFFDATVSKALTLAG